MLKPLYVGNLKIENPVILAPQAGVTDLIFRNLVSSFGGKEYSTSLTVSEMVPSMSQVYLSSKRDNLKLKKFYSTYTKLNNSYTSVQIFGNDSVVMADSAKINQELGADIIDINMGCPVNKIIKNGCGADLMKNLTLAENIVKVVVKSVKIPVSVKIRSGWDSNNKNAVEFAKMLENAGASFISIHGRTRNQFYSGKVDLEIIKDVKNSVKIPVIGNGDITSLEDAKNMLDYTGCDGIMVGRGIYGKPWFLSDIIYFLKTGKILENKDVLYVKSILLSHFEQILKFYGTKAGIFYARKHLAWYSKGIKNSAEFREIINKTEDITEIYSLINKFFV